MATKDYSSIQEKMIADKLGWSVVSGSGAAACHPGDVISENWLGECKTHVESGHKIFFSKSVWEKIKDEAMTKHRYPVLFTDDGSQNLKKTWCLFKLDVVETELVDGICLHPIVKGVNVNITVSNDILYDEYKKNKSDIFTSILFADWGKDRVAILPFSLFAELFSE